MLGSQLSTAKTSVTTGSICWRRPCDESHKKWEKWTLSGENDPFIVAVHRLKKKKAGPAQKERCDRDWMVLPFSVNMSVGTGRPCRSKVKTASLMYLSPREISYQPPSSVMLKCLILSSYCCLSVPNSRDMLSIRDVCPCLFRLNAAHRSCYGLEREAVCNGDFGLFVCSVSIVSSSACAGIHSFLKYNSAIFIALVIITIGCIVFIKVIA